jgi:group I intron endonuclease
MMNGMGLIYVATHVDSGKVYVGQTIQGFRKRLVAHRRRDAQSYFCRALKKYGVEAFQFRLIPCPANSLDAVESVLIATYGSMSPNGFNLTGGGGGCRGRSMSEDNKRKLIAANTGIVRSDETRKKISMAQIGGHKNLGKRATEATKRKLSIAKTGRVMPYAIRQKISEGMRGKQNCIGVHPSAATREKMSASQLECWKRRKAESIHVD